MINGQEGGRVLESFRAIKMSFEGFRDLRFPYKRQRDTAREQEGRLAAETITRRANR